MSHRTGPSRSLAPRLATSAAYAPSLAGLRLKDTHVPTPRAAVRSTGAPAGEGNESESESSSEQEDLGAQMARLAAARRRRTEAEEALTEPEDGMDAEPVPPPAPAPAPQEEEVMVVDGVIVDEPAPEMAPAAADDDGTGTEVAESEAGGGGGSDVGNVAELAGAGTEAALTAEAEERAKEEAEAQLALKKTEAEAAAAELAAAQAEQAAKNSALESAKKSNESVKAYQDLIKEEKALNLAKATAEAAEASAETVKAIADAKKRLKEINGKAGLKAVTRQRMDAALSQLKADVAAAELALTEAKTKEGALKKTLKELEAASKKAAKALADKNRAIVREAADALKSERKRQADEKRAGKETAAAAKEAEKKRKADEVLNNDKLKQQRLDEAAEAAQKAIDAAAREEMCFSYICQMHWLREKLESVGSEAAEIFENVKDHDGCDLDGNELAWMAELTEHAIRVQADLRAMIENQGGWNKEAHRDMLKKCEQEDDADASEDGDDSGDDDPGDDKLAQEEPGLPPMFVKDGDFSADTEKDHPDYIAPDKYDEEEKKKATSTENVKAFQTTVDRQFAVIHKAEQLAQQQAAAGKGKSKANATVLIPRKKGK